MATDKGYTEHILKVIAEYAKKHQQFRWGDVKDKSPKVSRSALSSCLMRIQVKGIIKRIRMGTYECIVDDPIKAYEELWHKPTGDVPTVTKRRVGRPANGVQPPVSNVSMMTLSDHQELIRIGKRLWLGVEVALVPKGGDRG